MVGRVDVSAKSPRGTTHWEFMGLFKWLRRRSSPSGTSLPETAPKEVEEVGGPFSPGRARLPKSHPKPKRPTLHVFQHVALPEAAFENHPELLRELRFHGSSTPLVHFWSRARLHCLLSGLVDTNICSDPQEDAARTEMMESVLVRSENCDGLSVHVVEMPKPENPGECYFTAIVRASRPAEDGSQTCLGARYLTLELSRTGGTVLAEWRRDGTYVPLGEGSRLDFDQFLASVRNICRAP